MGESLEGKIKLNKNLSNVSGTEIEYKYGKNIEGDEFCNDAYLNDLALEILYTSDIEKYGNTGYLDNGSVPVLIWDRNDACASTMILRNQDDFNEDVLLSFYPGERALFYNTVTGAANNTPMIAFINTGQGYNNYDYIIDKNKKKGGVTSCCGNIVEPHCQSIYDEISYNEVTEFSPFDEDMPAYFVYGIEKETLKKYIIATETKESVARKIVIQRITNNYKSDFDYNYDKFVVDYSLIEKHEKHASYYEWDEMIEKKAELFNGLSLDELASILIDESFDIMKTALNENQCG